ncbi:glutamate synthase (NADPH) homotetrameric [Clostridium sp. CAG:571]|jgi:glutamate synthase (NADPH/NADH) small chain|nr:glutamate synthase (NADPH) homotetrameric [Clostridium sp. CAG:571]
MYNNKTVKEKVDYCLNCKTKPCTVGCPLNNDIPNFIKNIKLENYEEAYKILSNTTVMPAVCGRICPHMSQCMGKCIRGIKSKPVSIGELEYNLADFAMENKFDMKELEKDCTGKKVAIIGSGPAGLTCAAFLARRGTDVTIFEKYSDLGGILRHGIPSFRLSEDILDSTIQKILNLGIGVEYNKEVGKNISLKEISEKYDAVFIAIGANIPWKMGIEGEVLNGVYGRKYFT